MRISIRIISNIFNRCFYADQHYMDESHIITRKSSLNWIFFVFYLISVLFSDVLNYFTQTRFFKVWGQLIKWKLKIKFKNIYQNVNYGPILQSYEKMNLRVLGSITRYKNCVMSNIIICVYVWVSFILSMYTQRLYSSLLIISQYMPGWD